MQVGEDAEEEVGSDGKPSSPPLGAMAPFQPPHSLRLIEPVTQQDVEFSSSSANFSTISSLKAYPTSTSISPVLAPPPSSSPRASLPPPSLSSNTSTSASSHPLVSFSSLTPTSLVPATSLPLPPSSSLEREAMWPLLRRPGGRVRRLWLVLLFAALYLLTARTSLLLAFRQTNASPVWPPSGIALCTLLLEGSHMWPGVLIGATLANAWVFVSNLAGVKPPLEILLASLLIGLGNTGEALVAEALISRFIGRNIFPVHTVDGSLKFLLICPLACLVSSLFGTVTLCVWAVAKWPAFSTVWFTWWLGDFSGMFTVAPAIMACCYRPPGGIGKEWGTWANFRMVLEATALFGLLLGLCALIFGGTLPTRYVLSLPYMVMPMIIWVAFRFNRRGLPMAILVVTGAAMYGACQEKGPFHRVELNESLLQVQLFNSVLAMMGTLLAAAVRERKDSLNALNALNCTLEQRVAERTTELQALNKKLMKSQEAAWAASQAKSQFLASMSHEIRTPIHGILGMTDLTLDSQISSQQREQLETVTQSANHLLMIVNDILDISKIEAGKLELEEEAFAVRMLVAGTMRMLSARAQQKGLAWQWHVDPAVPDTVVGDPARLRQCLVNLVGNAVKFTSEGFVKVEVTMETAEGVAKKLPPFWRIDSEMESRALILKDTSPSPAESSDSEAILLFAVTDTGIGVPEDKLQLIFRSFEQADASMTRMYGGTGLGLSITSRLVAMMGGQIWVESRVDKGSTFFFSAKLRLAPSTSMVRSISQGSPRRLDRCPSAPARLPTAKNSALLAAAAMAVAAVDGEKDSHNNSEKDTGNVADEGAYKDADSATGREGSVFQASETREEREAAGPSGEEEGHATGCCPPLSDGVVGERDRDRANKYSRPIRQSDSKGLAHSSEENHRIRLLSEDNGPDRANISSTQNGDVQESKNYQITRLLITRSLDLMDKNVQPPEEQNREEHRGISGQQPPPKNEKGVMRGLNYRFGLSRIQQQHRDLSPSLTGKIENFFRLPSPTKNTQTDAITPKVKRNLLRGLRRLPAKLTAKDPTVNEENEGSLLSSVDRTTSSPYPLLDPELVKIPSQTIHRTQLTRLPVRPDEKDRSRRKSLENNSPLPSSSVVRTESLPDLTALVIPPPCQDPSPAEPSQEPNPPSEGETVTAEPPQRALSRPAAPEELQYVRFLLADDSPVNQMVACRYLRKKGLEVDAVGDGAQVLQKLEERPGLYILLLLDVQMPVMDGIETVKAIRKKEQEENLRHLPVIGLTAHAADTFRERCLAAGMDAYLSKPFTMDQLLGAIEGTLTRFGQRLPKTKS